MREFAKYILRTRHAKKKRRGNVVEILINNKPVAKYRIRNRQKVYIDAYRDDEYESLREVIRFDLSKHNKPVVMDKVQCTGETCFQRLVDEFPREYNAFMRHCDDTSDVVRALSLLVRGGEAHRAGSSSSPDPTVRKAGSGKLPEDIVDVLSEHESESLDGIDDALKLIFETPNSLDTIKSMTRLMQNFKQRLQDVTRR